MKVTKECLQCGKGFSNYEYADRIRKFCSKKCHTAHGVANGFGRTQRKDNGTRKSEWASIPCNGCGATVERRRSEVRESVYCSHRCYGKYGASAAGEKGGPPLVKDWRLEPPFAIQPETEAAIKAYECKGWLVDKGYLYLRMPKHPVAQSNGRVAEHRLVAYHHSGKDALTGHHVDHINGDRADNRWENLQVLTPQEHMVKTYHSEGPGYNKRFFEWAQENYPGLLTEFRSL